VSSSLGMFFSFPFAASLTLCCAVGRLTKVTLAGVAVLLGAAGARAESESSGVEVHCSALDRGESEELSARVHLLFTERALEPTGIELRCTSSEAWVVWGDERLPVERRTDLSDAFIDAVDARLALAYRELPDAESPALEPSTPRRVAGAHLEDRTVTFSLPPPTPAETPQFDRPLRLTPASKRWPELYRPEGGLSLGVDIDSSHGELEASWGPRLEVGLPIGMFTLLGAETARFGSSTGRSTTMNLGAEVGVGFGAPYARGAPLGLALRAFSDWFVGYTRDATIAQTFWAPGVALGLRAALDAPLIPWIGLDGRFRFEALDLGDAESQPLPQLTAMVTVGVGYLADGPRAFSRPQKTRALVAQGSPSLSLGPDGT
jgi:hypothetical protein